MDPCGCYCAAVELEGTVKDSGYNVLNIEIVNDKIIVEGEPDPAEQAKEPYDTLTQEEQIMFDKFTSKEIKTMYQFRQQAKEMAQKRKEEKD